MTPLADGYNLARGEKDVERLRLLNEIYGPGSQALLRQAGLVQGMRVVEIGCGSGNMTQWLAAQVGPSGSVVALDISEAQVEQARRLAEVTGASNVTFKVADVYVPGLPQGSFDLAHCRLVLMHLTRPVEALRAIRDLVKPGGAVVCEEMDLSRWLCEPPAALMARSFELKLALSDARGQHWRIGSRLHRLFLEADLTDPVVSAKFPVVLRGASKRLLAISFHTLGKELLAEGLARQDELEAIEAEMERIAADDTTLLGLPYMGQVWTVKSPPRSIGG